MACCFMFALTSCKQNEDKNTLHGVEIRSNIFTINEATLYTKVSNSQETFSFINAVTVAENATYVVATDLAANNVIRTKTVSLEEGDNTFYVLVENGNEIHLYTATIRRKPMYDVEIFRTDYDSTTVSVEEGACLTKPQNPIQTGYEFQGWDFDFTKPITKNTTIVAQWKAKKYTVTCNPNGGNIATKEYVIEYGSSFVLDIPTLEGHNFVGWNAPYTPITNENGFSLCPWGIDSDIILTARWNVNSYDVSVEYDENAGDVKGAGTKVFHSEATLTASEPNLGYNWLGWFNDDKLLSLEPTYIFTMPANDIVITAKYEVKEEMSNFNFTSTTSVCNISEIKDKTSTEVFLPDYITSIDSDAFVNCDKLKYNQYNGAYYLGNTHNPYMAVIKARDTSITSCSIHADTKIIANSAFRDCYSLISVTMGNNITSIGPYAFSGCDLIVITIPDGVTSIGHNAFSYCSNLRQVTIPDSVTSIGSDAFLGCNELKYNEYDNASYLGNNSNPYVALIRANNKTIYYQFSCIVNSNTKIIYDNAFENCGLTSITIPNGVKRIGSYAFSGCGALKSVEIPNSVEYMGSYIFENCSNLTNVTISDNVTSIGEQAFKNCSKITNIVIPNSVKSIGANAFSNCKNMKCIVIPNSVRTIRYYAFAGCDSLVTVYYTGLVSEWSNISINKNHGNDTLISAKRYYYSETLPTDNENYWHYDDNGDIVKW